MAINKVQPVHAVNRYLWSRIKSEGILTESDYEGMVPIVPIKETPDLITIIDAQPGISSLPYIVYTWSRGSNNGEWYLETHELAYSVRSADEEKLGQLIKLFNLEFRDYDRAAMRVNAYIQNNGTASQKAFQFKYINVMSLGAAMPADTENGVDEALITISATFVDNARSNFDFGTI